MAQEIWAGRSILKRFFHEFFIRIVEDTKETRSFLSFSKTEKDQEPYAPQILIFQGENGLGKTAAIAQCCTIVTNCGNESKIDVASIVIDFDDLFLKRSCVPSTARDLIESIFAQIQEKSSIEQYFVKYREYSDKLAKVEAAINRLQQDEWPLEKPEVLSGATGTTADQQYKDWLQKKLGHHDFDIFINNEKHRTEYFVKGLLDASVDIPFLLAFDSYENIPAHLEVWLRRELITRIYESRSRIITIVSGAGHFSRFFRNDFPEGLLYTFDFSDDTLTVRDITALASKTHCQLNDNDINIIEQYTAGIPIAIIDLMNYVNDGYSCSALTSEIRHEPWNAQEILQEVLDRYLSCCKDEQSKYRLISLGLIDQFDPSILAELWDLEEPEITTALNDLRRHTVFFSNDSLHSTIRLLLREYLIKDITNKTNGYSKLFSAHKEICEKILSDRLTTLQSEIPDTKKRYKNSVFADALLNLIGSSMWTASDDALNHFSAHYLELLYFNPEMIYHIIWRMGEFQSFLSLEQDTLLSMLHKGVAFAGQEFIDGQVPADPVEIQIVEHLDKISSSLNPFQQALLYRKKGELEYRAGNFEKAIAHFKKGYDTCCESDSDCSFFYNNFILCGQALKAADKQQEAIDAFTIASTISPESFVPLYLKGLSNVTLSRFDDAIAALSLAIKFNPDHQDALYNLGRAYAEQNNYKASVDILSRAIDKGPTDQFLQFEYGKSLNKLNRHKEAVDSLRKVTEINQTHGEAWYLIGTSSAALEMADDAIAAFKKAIEIAPEKADTYQALADVLYSKKQYDDAADAYEKALSFDKDNNRLWSKLAKVFFDTQKFEQAIEAGQKSVGLKDNDLESWMTLGSSYLALNNYTDAIAAFEKASTLDPQNSSIWNSIGKSYVANDDYDKAIDAFSKAVSINPSIDGSWYDLGLAYSVKERFADAANAFVKAVEIEPQNSHIWLQLGDMYMVLRQFTDAVTSYAKTVEIEPTSYDAYYRKGLACMETHEIDDAIVAFVKAAELSSNDIDIWYQMGIAYYTGGHYNEAIQAFDMASNLDPLRPDIKKQLGCAKMALGNYSEAIDAFAKSLELITDDCDCLIQMGMCYNYLQKYNEAIDTLQKAQQLQPENIIIYQQLGLVCHTAGDLDSAIEYYRIITEKDPMAIDAWMNMGLALHYKSDFNNAVAIYQKVIEIAPDNAETWYNLGLAYHGANNYNDAICAYRQAVKLTPDNIDMWFHLGMALNALELYGESIQAYRKVVHLDNDNIDAWFNLGLSYFVWGQYDDALESYEKVIEDNPKHFEALANLGATYYALSNADKTIEYCSKALDIRDEPSTRTYLLLGYILKKDMVAAGAESEALLSVELTREEISDVIEILRSFTSKDNTVEIVHNLIEKLGTVLV